MGPIRIIMTECEVRRPSGRSKYVTFCVKGTGKRVGEVHRTVDGKYRAYAGLSEDFMLPVGTRSSKQSAIALAQECIKQNICEYAEFKWNVMREIYKTI